MESQRIPGRPEMEDGQLLSRHDAGDEDAFAQLVRRWKRRVLSLAYRMLGDEHEAEDAQQIIFLRAYQALTQFDRRSEFGTWLYRIAINHCRDRLRRRRNMMSAMEAGDEPEMTNVRARDAHRHESGEREASARVRRAVQRLPERELEAIVLKHYAGMTFAEAAALLDVPVSTLKSRVLSALNRLRRDLGDHASRGG